MCREVLTGVTEEGTLLEGLRKSFWRSCEPAWLSGVRVSATLPHIQQVTEGFQVSSVGKRCRREREKVTKMWSESIAESFQKAPGR